MRWVIVVVVQYQTIKSTEDKRCLNPFDLHLASSLMIIVGDAGVLFFLFFKLDNELIISALVAIGRRTEAVKRIKNHRCDTGGR